MITGTIHDTRRSRVYNSRIQVAPVTRRHLQHTLLPTHMTHFAPLAFLALFKRTAWMPTPIMRPARLEGIHNATRTGNMHRLRSAITHRSICMVVVMFGARVALNPHEPCSSKSESMEKSVNIWTQTVEMFRRWATTFSNVATVFRRR